MLLIPGSSASRRRLCSGVSRRDALRIGGLGAIGLSLPQLLRAEAADAQPAQPAARRHKSVIMIYLCGGPPHQDMYDIKQEVFATIYHNLGVNLEQERVFDFRGVPRSFLEPGTRPIRELVG